MVLKASEGSGFSIPLTRAVGEQQCCAGDPSRQTVFFPGAASPTGALTDVSQNNTPSASTHPQLVNGLISQMLESC